VPLLLSSEKDDSQRFRQNTKGVFRLLEMSQRELHSEPMACPRCSVPEAPRAAPIEAGDSSETKSQAIARAMRRERGSVSAESIEEILDGHAGVANQCSQEAGLKFGMVRNRERWVVR
jgi:predicted transcriptional regulator